jgi:hypothetical protein
MFTKWRMRVLLSILMLALALGSTGWLFNTLRAAEKPNAEPWPPFTMVYTDWSATRGPDGTPGFVRARIIYQDSRHWRSEILEDSVMPSYAGSFTEFNGKQLSGFNAAFNHSATVNEPNSPKLAPDDWLLPGQISYLKQKPDISLQLTTKPGLDKLVRSEQIACDPDVSRCEKAISQIVTEILFDSKYELPMGMTVYSNNQKSRQVTVDEFSWTARSR